ncbi:MAG: hypothetical protein R3C24_10995 [Cyanobacteriota/Melainabacteria group bacterium]
MKSGKLLLVAILFILSGLCVTTAFANPYRFKWTAQESSWLASLSGCFLLRKQANVQSLGTNGKGRIYRVKFIARDDVKRV